MAADGLRRSPMPGVVVCCVAISGDRRGRSLRREPIGASRRQESPGRAEGTPAGERRSYCPDRTSPRRFRASPMTSSSPPRPSPAPAIRRTLVLAALSVLAASTLLPTAAGTERALAAPFLNLDNSLSDAKLVLVPKPPGSRPPDRVDDTWNFVDGRLVARGPEKCPVHTTPAENALSMPFTDGSLPPLSVQLEGLGRLTCRACHGVVRRLQDTLLRNKTEAAVVEVASKMCELFRVQTPRVCAELIPQFGPWALQVLVRAAVDPDKICSELKLCAKLETPDVSVAIPPRTPESPSPDGPKVGRGGKHLYVVHISDWHFDEEYMEGYEADCPEPICCRPPYSPDQTARLLGRPIMRPAGRYGDFNCDVPRSLVESLINFLPTAVPQVDFVFMTGDMPPHDIWSETQKSVLAAEEQTAFDIRRAFQHTAVFATIGNHEGAPINDYPTRRLVDRGVADPIDWLYSALSDQWSSWLPPNATISLRRNGYYSAPIAGVTQRRVIAINTNMGYRFNWWLLLTRREEPDPDGMLSWLVDELYRAEQNGEGVYIIGHMCPLDSDAHSWFGREFARIVSRFSGTILGQFYGHTHKDEFQVFYSSVPSVAVQTSERDYGSPIGVAYIGPSLTPYKGVNPSFRVYEIDEETGVVLDHKTYYLDLPKANEPGGSPHWKELYTAKAGYGLESVTAKDWAALANRFRTDEDALTQYLYLRTRMAASASFVPFLTNKAVPCHESAKCRKAIICKTLGGRIFPQRGCPGPEDLRGKVPWVVGGARVQSEGEDAARRGGGEECGARSGRLSIKIAGDDGDEVSVTGLAAEVLKMVGQLFGWMDDDNAGVSSTVDVDTDDGEEEPVCR